MFQQLKDQVQQDPHYQRFATIIALSREKTQVTQVMDEIRDIAEVRTHSSKLTRDAGLLKALMDENLRAQGYRSRLAEICVQATRHQSKLQVACDKLKDHVQVTYGNELRGMGRTKEERNVVVVSLLQDAHEYLNLLAAAVKMAEIVILDIDKQHYSLKLTVDALNLHVQKEHILS